MDSEKIIIQAEALLALDRSGSLRPHGIGGLARDVISMLVETVRERDDQLRVMSINIDGLKCSWLTRFFRRME